MGLLNTWSSVTGWCCFLEINRGGFHVLERGERIHKLCE
jgi:hypothetical protein